MPLWNFGDDTNNDDSKTPVMHVKVGNETFNDADNFLAHVEAKVGKTDGTIEIDGEVFETGPTGALQQTIAAKALQLKNPSMTTDEIHAVLKLRYGDDFVLAKPINDSPTTETTKATSKGSWKGYGKTNYARS
jgi:hypothetical protein